MLTIYLYGVFISAIVWFVLIKLRQGGFKIRMPRPRDGNILDPLNHGNVDYGSLMTGWFLMALLWPLGWFFLVGLFLIAWACEIIGLIWQFTIGNEKLARKIFGGKNV